MQPVEIDNGFGVTIGKETVGIALCNAEDLPSSTPPLCTALRCERSAGYQGMNSALRRPGSATCPRTKQHHSTEGSTTTHVPSCLSKMCPLAALSASGNIAAVKEVDDRKFEECNWDTRIRADPTKVGFVRTNHPCFVGICHAENTPQNGSLVMQEALPANWAGTSLVGKSESWRAPTSRSFNEENAALQRALGSMRTLSGEPEAVRRKLVRPQSFGDRSITGSDARTMSLREPGRWGSKIGGGTYYLAPMSVVETTQVQRIQCLHCGSFSTTPVSGGVRSKSRSQSFRRVRDYSWQQELHDQLVLKELRGFKVLNMTDRKGEARMGNCQGAGGFESDSDWQHVPESATFRQQGWAVEGSNASWKEHMFLSQMLAHRKNEMGSSSSRWASVEGGCDCSSCQNCASFRELQTFSGPIGYASESKGNVEAMMYSRERSSSGRKGGEDGGRQREAGWGLGRLMRGRGRRCKEQCVACGQRQGWRRAEGRRLCGKCQDRNGRQVPHKAAASRKWRLLKLCRYLLGFPTKTG